MEKHNILHEFPDLKEKIHALKSSNQHFHKIYDAYHEIDREIHVIETHGMSTDDKHLTELRKKRLHLKDNIFEMLNAINA